MFKEKGITFTELLNDLIKQANLNDEQEDIFDDAIIVVEEPEEPDILPGPTTPQENGVASLLLDAINDEIATIDKYNVILANIQTYPEFILVIQDILNEENNQKSLYYRMLLCIISYN